MQCLNMQPVRCRNKILRAGAEHWRLTRSFSTKSRHLENDPRLRDMGRVIDHEYASLKNEYSEKI